MIASRAGKSVPWSAVTLGLTWGLCASVWITLRVEQLPRALGLTLPLGVAAAIGLHVAFTRLLERWGMDPAAARAESLRVWTPSWVVGFAPVVLTVPARRLPGILVFLAVGLCLLRALSLVRRMRAVDSRRIESTVFLVVFLVGFVALFQVYIVHDGFQYYGYLASVAMDGDLNLYDQIYVQNTERFYNPFPARSARYIGTAVLQAPFFALGHVVAGAINLVEFRYPNHGYSLPYRFFVSLASALFGLGGLVVSYRLACELFRRSVAMMATLAVGLGSALVFFMYSWGGWAHPYALFFGATFLLVWYRTRDVRGLRDWCVLGVLGGALCLVRPSAGILFVFPFAEWLLAWRGKTPPDSRLRQRLVGPGLGTLIALAVFSPQLSIWRMISGRWLAAPYEEVGDYHTWLEPDVFGVLFSAAQHGLFTWTPLLLLASLGVFGLWRRDRLIAICSAIALVGTIYFYACWSIWWSGIGFSNRFFIELTPLFILGLAPGIEWLSRRTTRELAWSVLLLAMAWNLTLVADYRSNILSQGIPDPHRVVDEPLTTGELVQTGLGLEPRERESPLGSEWIGSGFVTRRLANMAVFGNFDGLLAVLLAVGVAGLFAFVLLRVALSKRVPRFAPRYLLAGAAVATIVLHVAIAWSAGRTAPPGEHYRFTDSFRGTQRFGEDIVLYADYDLPVSSIDLLTFLNYGHAVPQGKPVARVTVYDDAGNEVSRLLLAGIDTAEESYLRPEYRDDIRHGIELTDPVRDRPTHVYSGHMYDMLTYRSVFDLPQPMVVRKIRVRYEASVGNLVVADVLMRNHG